MRAFFLLPLLLICSCSSFTGGSSGQSLARPTDAEVIAAALSDFSRYGDMAARNIKADEAALFVNSHYERDAGFISKDHLAFNLSLAHSEDEPHWQVPEDARQDMEARTTKRESAPRTGLPAFVRVLNFDFPHQTYSDLYSEHPHALSFVRLYPPGYTRNGKQAIVVFSYPQCSAICLLVLRGGRWRLVHQHVLCFPT